MVADNIRTRICWDGVRSGLVSIQSLSYVDVGQ